MQILMKKRDILLDKKIKIYKKVVIECKVECVRCKKKFTVEYVNAQSISNLKVLTENWCIVKDIGTVCPGCMEYLLKEIAT
jgi:hypothetical protein